MNTIENKKLHEVFESKYKKLAFSDDRSFDTWSSYLKSVRCMPCEWKYQIRDIEAASESKDYEIIHNPSPFGGYIVVPTDAAFRILAIGLP